MEHFKNTPQRVQIESPFSGTEQVQERNEEYARACLKDSLQRGEAPFASHLLYTQVLDDNIPEERDMGIQRGFSYTVVCDLVAVYTDRGVSRGMRQGIRVAKELGLTVEERTLDGWNDAAL